MKKDLRFLAWHVRRGELDAPESCDCTLGLIWDVALSYEQAERLVQRWEATMRRRVPGSAWGPDARGRRNLPGGRL